MIRVIINYTKETVTGRCRGMKNAAHLSTAYTLFKGIWNKVLSADESGIGGG